MFSRSAKKVFGESSVLSGTTSDEVKALYRTKIASNKVKSFYKTASCEAKKINF